MNEVACSYPLTFDVVGETGFDFGEMTDESKVVPRMVTTSGNIIGEFTIWPYPRAGTIATMMKVENKVVFLESFRSKALNRRVSGDRGSLENDRKRMVFDF